MTSSADDPRLAGWRERATSRTREAVAVIASVPGVAGVIVGGSVARDEHWPLSDIDLIVIAEPHPASDVAERVDRAAYQVSELWGTSGVYTAVDAGRLTFSSAEVRWLAVGDAHATAAELHDHRMMHGIDKAYGGTVAHDPTGAASSFLDWANRDRFADPVARARVAFWSQTFTAAATDAERLTASDESGAWIAVRRAGAALAEIALEQRGLRTGSLGRFWTRFE
ncbi:MAG: nucleotidyltransferase domain-containing protein, partial [Propionibacteriaceae bacterium]